MKRDNAVSFSHREIVVDFVSHTLQECVFEVACDICPFDNRRMRQLSTDSGIGPQEAQLQHTVENQRQSEAPTHLPLVPTTAEGGVTAGGSGVRPIHYNPGRPPRYHRRGARRHLYKRWTDEQLKVADILYNADASGRGSGRGFVKFHFFFLFGLLFISLNLLFTLIFRLKN